MGNPLITIINDGGNYNDRLVERTDIGNGLTISTAHTSDEGYETAILDKGGAHPVERYGQSREDAVSGHARWLAKNLCPGKTIKKLGQDCGWLGNVPDKLHVLKGV